MSRIWNSVATIILISGCSSSITEFHGKWKVDRGFIFPPVWYTDRIGLVDNYVLFESDSVQMPTGIYYYTNDWYMNDYPEGRYSFIYVGDMAYYKIEGRTIGFYNEPYDKWINYQILESTKRRILLRSATGVQFMLIHQKSSKCRSIDNRFRSIEVKVSEIVPFGVQYKLKLHNDGNLIYTEYEDPLDSGQIHTYRLKGASYSRLRDKLNCIEWDRLKADYIDESGNRDLDVRVTLSDGKVYHLEIKGETYPDVLKEVLLPIIYSYQKYRYGNLKPIEL